MSALETNTSVEATVDTTEAPRYTRRETLLTMAGVLLVMLLASLDQTIVSTAMPHIIADFNGLDRYTWVTTAYLLTSTVMIPIYGKLSDLFGRKSIFLVGVVLFLLGSAVCGMAQSMNQLIVFRAFQGLGAAALMPIAIAVVGDLFPPRERGKWQGLTGAVFGLSSIVGPAAGGWITENANWRWVFYVNLPVGIAALLVLIFLMPSLHKKVANVSIDYLGAALLVVATVPLMLGLTWAGTQYAWLSVQVVGLFALSLAGFVAFFTYEGYLARKEKQPIIDPRLFKNSIFTIAIAISMITSMAMFGAIYFLPLFAQGILGISATDSGLLLSPMMLSLIAASIVSGLVVSRTGKYKIVAIVGMIISVIGASLLLRLDVHSGANDLWISMVVMGLGLGFGMSLYTLIVQNALPDKIGQATSALTFFRQIGGTIALSAMGSVMTSAYQPAFRKAVPASVNQFAAMAQKLYHKDLLGIFDNPNILLSKDTQDKIMKGFQSFPGGKQIYDQILEAVKIGLAQGIHNVFIFSVCFMVTGLLLVFFLKEIPLRSGRGKATADSAAQGAEDGTGALSPVMMH
ncbi:MFS transporter [Dictyobacter vulcani]|uniref:MFS transporter n=1 Tax=Dictyobacter vulcani TaxID=2607529 RepID=A0A5J4KSV8_9CHLR|nr:MDR family MFS transporter [Dictyobacter vulcani]GER90975.1 MFS transporter [Dictyobacter vulcani]